MTVPINYTFYSQPTAGATAGGPIALGVGVQQIHVFGFNIADCKFHVEPKAPDLSVSPAIAPTMVVPSKMLRVPSVKGAISQGSLLIDYANGKPHLDYQLCHDSTELVYIKKAVVGSGLVKKIMPAGAVIGRVGRMELYEGGAIDADVTGDYSQLLVREFTITAADLADRDDSAKWPKSGSAPTISSDYNIVDGGGDGWYHV